MQSNKDELEIRAQGNYNSEINLEEISYALLRNKKIIILFSILGFLAGVFNAIRTPRTWQGQFQIALNNDSKSMNIGDIGLNSRFSRFLPISSSANNLATEVEILSSPSVLIEVFNYVKNQKFKEQLQEPQKFRFDSWKNNLTVELKKNTSILNIKYIDNDKELIIPVLNKISSKYQKYSGEKREKNLTRGIDYYKNQIKIYREKSNKSIKKAQEFATKNDLSMISNITKTKSKDSASDYDFPKTLNVELIRVEASDEIRFFSEMLKQLDEYENNPNELVSFANSLQTKDSGRVVLIDKINEAENEIARLRGIYLDNDLLVKSALSKKKIFMNSLVKKLRDELNAKKNLAKAKLNSAKRPEGVLNKYRFLLRNLITDQKTLEQLEIEYRGLELEFAKIKEPWQLITEPTLTPNPVGKSRKAIATLGLITGLLSGISCVFIKEKSTGKIFKISELEKLCGANSTEVIKYNVNKNWEDFFQAVSLINLADVNNDFCLFFIGDFIDEVDNEIYKKICKYKVSKDIKKTKNLLEAINYKNILVIGSLGKIKKEYFEFVNKKFQKVNKKPILFIIIDQINK